MAVLLCKDANCIFFVSGKNRILRGENTAMGVGWGDGVLFARGAEAGE